MAINRLKINMQNKVEIIDGAINQCYTLMNGGKIELNGLRKMVITKGNITNEQFLKRINELEIERDNLISRIQRFKN